MPSPIAWFEIPAVDFARAVAFYQAVLQVQLRDVSPYTGSPYALFPAGPGDIGGAIGVGANYTPAHIGVTLYLRVTDGLDAALARVAPAGGQVLTPKSPLPQGFFAIIQDTEGNRIGLRE